MPDGQEKSDDLIAELARLMASGASASEPEAKPGPKLVSVPEATGTPVRVPGSAAPAAETTRPASPEPAVEPPRAAPVIRIPGMDQPVPSSRAVEPAPTPAPAPAVTPPSQPVPAIEMSAPPRPSSVDFGPAPAADPIRQEPLVSFRMPEAPKLPTQTVPPPAAAPVMPELRPSYSTSSSAAPAASPPVGVSPGAPAEPELPKAESQRQPAPQTSAPFVAPTDDGIPFTTARPQPPGDAFDFDFGFEGDASEQAPESHIEPVAPRPAPQAVSPSVAQPARQSSGDLIADLIAAELDATELGEALPVASFSPAPSRPAPSPVAPSSPPVAAPSMSMPRATPTAASFGGMANAPARPAAQTPRPVSAPTPAVEVERDPIDEIESLIGEAVRIELGNDRPAAASAPTPAAPSRVEPRASTPVPPPPAQSAPVVPPLTTGFAPRRAALKDNEINVSSAEAAIRAAAAAADSDVDVAAEPPVKRPRARRDQSGLLSGGVRQYVGMAVAGTLLLAAGFGLYWVLGMGGSSDGDVPVLQADTTPAKEAAPATPAATDTQGNVVFSEIDGSSTAEGEQLVSRDDSADTPIADVARTVGDDGEGVSESELANRKVRTVTVRPDGTIVSGDEAVAGNEALPVDRPSVPDLPGADVQPSELLATLPTNDASPTSAATPAVDATGALAATATDAATTATGEPLVPGSTVTTASGATAPVPMPAPNRQALASRVAAAPAAVEAPAAAAAPAAAPVAVSSGGSGPYAQLSSQPSEADARAALARLQPRLGGAPLQIRQVDLGSKGVWYRVVLPTGSFQEATQVCATIKANGNDCLPING